MAETQVPLKKYYILIMLNQSRNLGLSELTSSNGTGAEALSHSPS